MPVSNKLIITGVAAACLIAASYVSLNRKKSTVSKKELEDCNDSSKDDFQKMADEVSRSSSLQQGDMLLLYGLYKQATIGNIEDSDCGVPSKFNVVAYAKYQAWKKFSGIPSDAAKMQYVEVARQLLKEGGMGNINDDIVYENDDGEEDVDYEVEGPVDDTLSAMGSKPSVMAVPADNTMIENRSDILIAASTGNEKMIKEILKNSAYVDANSTDESGQTALHFLADRGDIASIKALLDAGADVNACDNDGISILSVAATVGRVDICDLLIKAGADIDKADTDGETPRSIAKCSGSNELLNLFDQSSTTPVVRESPKKVKELIHQFDKPQTKDLNKQSTPTIQQSKPTNNIIDKAIETVYNEPTSPVPMKRWADIDDSSDEEDLFPMEQVSVTASQLNDGFITPAVALKNDNTAVSDTNMYGVINDDDSSEEEPEKVVKGNEIAPVEDKSDTKPTLVKPLSKKEKKALKAKEMDDLDALLNEFGVVTAADDGEEKKEDEVLQDPVSDTKRRKKKNRKNLPTVTNENTDRVYTNGDLADVSEVMKAKSAKTTKSNKGSSAAAIAAKEMQKQKEINSKLKKKKKKPSYPRK